MSLFAKTSRIAIFLASTTALTPVWAQQAPQGPNAGFDEIVVTAEKRESTVQKTPISMSAISGDALQEQGISSAVDALASVPSVSFKTAGPGQTEFEMRGLTSTGGESPTVGFYLDDTPLTPPAMGQSGKVVIDPNLFDLNRLEVLRGPQGTLYGSGSMGGTIKLVTNQPDPNGYAVNADAVLSGTEGGGFNHTENVMGNIPLIDGKAALRVVVTDKRDDGWIDRIVVSPFPTEVNNSLSRGPVASGPVTKDVTDANWELLEGQRASLLLLPTDGLSVEASVLHQRIGQGGPNTIDVPPGNEAHYQPFDQPEPYSDNFTLASLTVKYDLGLVDLTSATSYWQRRQSQTQDISEAMQYFIGGFLGPPAAFPFTTAAGGLGAGTISELDKTHQLSEEFRVASKGAGPFQWQLGTFYSSFSAGSHVFSYYDGFTALFGTNNLADNLRILTMEQEAVFGEASYQVLDQLKATIGLRWFNYSSNSATQVSGVSASGTSAVQYGSASDSGVTPKFNLSYTPTDDVTVYSTAAKGFRPGGPNSPLPMSGTVSCAAALQALGLSSAPSEFGPDTVWSYELGEKATTADQRLRFNSDVYYETWDGVQQQVAPACGFKFTENAGQAQVYGAELEAAFKVTPEWTVTQAGGYTHARISTGSLAAGVAEGQKLLDVPDWTASTALVYTHPLTDEYNFVGRFQNDYVGPMQDITYARNDVPAHDIMSLRAGLIATHWSGFLFIDNLTNKTALLGNTGALSANVPIFNRVATNQPRTFGVDLNVQF
jgi:outer membrane receptor protein involved in Fe transport